MGRIRRPPKSVRFKYPTGEVAAGRILKEVRSRVYRDERLGEYVYVIQLIRLETGDEVVRLGCYRRPFRGGDDEWVYAGQTTFAIPRDRIRELIEDAEKRGIL